MSVWASNPRLTRRERPPARTTWMAPDTDGGLLEIRTGTKEEGHACRAVGRRLGVPSLGHSSLRRYQKYEWIGIERSRQNSVWLRPLAAWSRKIARQASSRLCRGSRRPGTLAPTG
jgi:hypothetical protein